MQTLKRSCTLLLLAFTTAFAAENTDFRLPDSSMAGHWQGTGREIVTWCSKDTIAFDLVIAADGTVTGTIGDARILSGTLRRNNQVLRKLGNRPYLIKARLEGAIVADEGIVRDRITLFLDFKDGKFNGGFRTSGWEFGGKKRMAMTGVDVRLKRVKPKPER